jgi:hypothetical protein
VRGLTRTVELRLGAPPRGCAIDMAVIWGVVIRPNIMAACEYCTSTAVVSPSIPNGLQVFAKS